MIKIGRQHQTWLIIMGLSLLVILLRLPSLEHPFDNDSAANAYHARYIWRGEPLYGTHHPAHHLPAVYYIYTLAFALFGDSLWSVKFFLVLWIIMTVTLLYRLGALIINRTVGFLAAIFYGILTAHVWMWGNSAEIELFANLPRIAAFLAVMQLTRTTPLSSQPSATWKFIFVGMLSAFAFLFKAIYLSPLVLAGLVLFLDLHQNRTKADAWQATMARAVWIGLGYGIILLLPISYFAALGLLPRLLSVFSLGQDYTHLSTGGPQDILFYPILGLAYNNGLLLTFSLAGLIIIVSKKTYRATALLLVVVWFVLSFVEAGGFVRIFRFYYYLLIVPPLALLASWFLHKLYYDLHQRQTVNPRLASLTAISLLTLTLAVSVVQNFNFYAYYVRYKLGYESRREFLLNGSPFGRQLLQLQELADYIRQRTTSTDHVYYWSEDVQVYYLADRRCATEFIWPIYLAATGSPERIFAAQTKYIIVDTTRPEADWLWLYPGLAQNYKLETVMYDQEIYRRLAKDNRSDLSERVNPPIFAADQQQ